MRRSRAAWALVLAVAPGLLVFALYYFAWGGPVPREVLREHDAHALLEPGPALILPSLRRLGHERTKMILAAASVICLAAWSER